MGGAGITLEDREDPTGAQVLDQQSELGKGAGQQVVELVEDAGVLACLGLEPAGDLAEDAHRRRERGRGFGCFRDGEAGAGVGFDQIVLFRAEDGDPIILVAFGIAAGDGFAVRQGLQEGEQVVRIATGDVEAHVEVDVAGVLGGDGVQTLAELLIAEGGLEDFEVGGGGLQIGAEKGGVMAIA